MHIHSFYRLWLLFGLHTLSTIAQDYTCAPDRPCALGCCSNGGVCGLGPTFCGAGNCTSTCDQKSECDPGWGSTWSKREKCPLNVCCSEFGFCGTTKDFCGDKSVKKPSCGGKSSAKRTIGYYEGWSLDRKCDGMNPESIAIGAYTHLNFAFAFVDPVSYKVSPMAANQVQLYKKVTGLKKLNPGMEVWISIGGWSMNDPDQPTAQTFSNLAGSTANQDLFFRSLISFMETYGFDGVDLDWEYPVAEERSGKPADFDNYTTFLANLKRALGSSGHKYGLTITIPSSFWYMQHFDIAKQAKSVDWFNIMSYDLHGTWDASSKWVGSIVGSHTNLTEIDNALDLLWRNDISPDQVVLGLGLYGRSFTLANPSCNTPGCAFSSGGKAGPCTGSVGTLSYAEILKVIAAGATVTYHKEAAVKQAVWDTDQWVSYDDAQTLGQKVEYANKLCLGGTMIWAVSQDTTNGAGASALSDGTELFPGTKQLQRAQEKTPDVLSPEGQCFITQCSKTPNKECPINGWGAVQQLNGNKQDVSIGHGCGKGESRTYCCPKNDMPTCFWKGSAPSCTAGCDKGDLELTYDTNGCSSNHKTLCCKKTTSDAAVSKCVWKGTASLCSRDNKCPSDKPLEIARSNTGDNQQPCDFDSIHDNLKVLCCEDPSPLTNCNWFTKGDQDPPPSPRPYKCSGKCPRGKSLIATDNMCFGGGTRVLCCDAPATYNDQELTDFKNKLNAFENPLSCPSSQTYAKRQLENMEPTQNQHHPEINQVSKNDQDIESANATQVLMQQPAMLERDFKKAGGMEFISLLLAALSANTFIGKLKREAYDNIAGNNNNMKAESLIKYVKVGSGAEQEAMDQGQALLSAMCQGRQAAATLADLEANSRDLCFPISHNLKRAINANLTHLEPRVFDLGNGQTTPTTPQYPRPWTGSFLQAIATRDPSIRFLYMRRIDYDYNTRGTQGPVHQQILEVAYDLRGAPQLQERSTDIFGVMHFHVDGIDPDNSRLAVRSVGMFHGQAITHNTATSDYRVNGRATRAVGGNAGSNTRTHVLQCDDEDPNDHMDTEYFQPGLEGVGTTGTGSAMIYDMGLTLFSQGILVPTTVDLGTNNLILQGQHPGGGQESANFGPHSMQTGGPTLVDLSTQGYPVIP